MVVSFFVLKIGKHLQLRGRAVQQEIISRAERSWTNPLNAFQDAFHYSFIKILHLLFFLLVRILCSLRLESGKNYQHGLDAYLWNFSFFSRGDVLPTHSELCLFVSGSTAKHQISSPVIILLKKILSVSAIAICLGKMWLLLSFARASRSVE